MSEKRASTKVTMIADEEEDVIKEEMAEEEEPVLLSIDEDLNDEGVDLENANPEDLIVNVEDLDEDQELFEGGPTAGEVVAWKNKYGDIYLTAIDYDTYFIWRTINRGEYREHVKNMAELTSTGRLGEIEATLFNEEAICEMCTLFPKMSAASMSGAMAGVPALITQNVMEASGFMSLEVRQL